MENRSNAPKIEFAVSVILLLASLIVYTLWALIWKNPEIMVLVCGAVIFVLGMNIYAVLLARQGIKVRTGRMVLMFIVTLIVVAIFGLIINLIDKTAFYDFIKVESPMLGYLFISMVWFYPSLMKV